MRNANWNAEMDLTNPTCDPLVNSLLRQPTSRLSKYVHLYILEITHARIKPEIALC